MPTCGTVIEVPPYTSWLFGHRLREAGLMGSLGKVAQVAADDGRVRMAVDALGNVPLVPGDITHVLNCFRPSTREVEKTCLDRVSVTSQGSSASLVSWLLGRGEPPRGGIWAATC